MTLLEDDKWGQWSDSDIARQCAVHQTTVMRMRESLMQSIGEAKPTTRTYTTKHGTTATMKKARPVAGLVMLLVSDHQTTPAFSSRKADSRAMMCTARSPSPLASRRAPMTT